jgi:hypothetical protein
MLRPWVIGLVEIFLEITLDAWAENSSGVLFFLE